MGKKKVNWKNFDGQNQPVHSASFIQMVGKRVFQIFAKIYGGYA